MAFDLGALQARITADSTNFDQGMARAQATMANFTKNTASSLSATAQKFRTFGYLSSAALTVPIVMAGKAILKMASDYEYSMQKIVGLAGVAQEAVNKWNKEVLAMSPVVAKGPKELAEALYFISSSGVKGAAAMDVLTLSAKAASAGLGETQSVANLLTSVLLAYAGTGETAAHATDVLVAAVREGKAEATGFASAVGSIIPLASEMGVSFDQVAGGMAAITLTGSTAAQAATYLKGVFNSLLKATKQGEKALNSMGSSYQELRDILRNEGLIPLMQKIRDMSVEYGETLASDVFPNIRALTAYLSISGKNFKYNQEMMDRVTNSAGSMDTAWKSVADTIQIRMKTALAQVNVAMVTLGNSIAVIIIPIFTKLAEWLSNITKWFDGLSEAGKRWRVVSVLIVAALGPLSLLISLLLYSVNGLKLALTGLITGGLNMVKVFGAWAYGLFNVTAASAAATTATVGVATANAKVILTEALLVAAKERVVVATAAAVASNYTEVTANEALAVAQAEVVTLESALTVAKGELAVATNVSTAASAREVAVTARYSALQKTRIALNTALVWTYGKLRTGALLALGAENLAITSMRARNTATELAIARTTAYTIAMNAAKVSTAADIAVETTRNAIIAKSALVERLRIAVAHQVSSSGPARIALLATENELIALKTTLIIQENAAIAANNAFEKASAVYTTANTAAIGAEATAIGVETAIQGGATVGKIAWVTSLKASTAWIWLSTLGTRASAAATSLWTGVTMWASVVMGALGKSIKGTTVGIVVYETVTKAAAKATVAWGVVTAAFSKIMKSTFMMTAGPIALAAGIVVAATAAVVALTLLIGGLVKAKKANKELIEIEKQHFEASQETEAQIGKESAELEILVAALKANNVPMAVRAKLVQEFNDKYGQYLGYLIDEKTGIDDLTKAYETLVPMLRSRLELEGAIAYAGTAAADKAKTNAEIQALGARLAILQAAEDKFYESRPGKRRMTTTDPWILYGVGKKDKDRSKEDVQRLKDIVTVTGQLAQLRPKLIAQENNYEASLIGVQNASEASNKKTEEANKLAEEKAAKDQIVTEGIANMTAEEKKAFNVKEKAIKQLETEIKTANDLANAKQKELDSAFKGQPLVTTGADYKFWVAENEKIVAARKTAKEKQQQLDILNEERDVTIKKEYAEKQKSIRDRLVKELSATDLASYDKAIADLKAYEDEKKQLLKEKETADKAVEAFKTNQLADPVKYVKEEGDALLFEADKIQIRLNDTNARITEATMLTTKLSGEALATNYDIVLGYLDRLEQDIKDKKEELGKLSESEVKGKKGIRLRGEIESLEYELKQAQLSSKDIIEEQIKRNKALQIGAETAVKARLLTAEEETAELFDIRMKGYDEETALTLKSIIGEQERIDYAAARKVEKERELGDQLVRVKREAAEKYRSQMESDWSIERMLMDRHAEMTITDQDELALQLEKNRLEEERKKLSMRSLFAAGVPGLLAPVPDMSLAADTKAYEIAYEKTTKSYINGARARARAAIEEKNTEKGALEEAQKQWEKGNLTKRQLIEEERAIRVQYYDFLNSKEEASAKWLRGLTREELNYTISSLEAQVKTAKRLAAEDVNNVKLAEEAKRLSMKLTMALNTKAIDDEEKRLSEFQTAAKSMIESFATDMAVGLGTGIGNILSGQDFGFQTILDAFADFLINMGKLVIAYGVTMKAFKLAFKKPWEAIAAGIALVAIGTMIKNSAEAGPAMGRLAPAPNTAYGGAIGLADGGILTGPQLVLAGEYAGARKNPEVYMPLNKLQTLLDNRGSGGGVLTAVVTGKDLKFVLDQENKFLTRS